MLNAFKIHKYITLTLDPKVILDDLLQVYSFKSLESLIKLIMIMKIIEK